jgi:hypothetical protein
VDIVGDFYFIIKKEDLDGLLNIVLITSYPLYYKGFWGLCGATSTITHKRPQNPTRDNGPKN